VLSDAAAMAKVCDLPASGVAALDDTAPTFSATVERLARDSAGTGRDVVFVMHREGIYDLVTGKCGKRWMHGTPRYCCCCKFTFDARTGAWTLEEYDAVEPKYMQHAADARADSISSKLVAARRQARAVQRRVGRLTCVRLAAAEAMMGRWGKKKGGDTAPKTARAGAALAGEEKDGGKIVI